MTFELAEATTAPQLTTSEKIDKVLRELAESKTKEPADHSNDDEGGISCILQPDLPRDAEQRSYPRMSLFRAPTNGGNINDINGYTLGVSLLCPEPC